MPASTAEPKSRNLPTNPASGGKPASESIDRVITDAEHAAGRGRSRSSAAIVSPSSTSRSRMMTTAKAAIVIDPVGEQVVEDRLGARRSLPVATPISR